MNLLHLDASHFSGMSSLHVPCHEYRSVSEMQFVFKQVRIALLVQLQIHLFSCVGVHQCIFVRESRCCFACSLGILQVFAGALAFARIHLFDLGDGVFVVFFFVVGRSFLHVLHICWEISFASRALLIINACLSICRGACVLRRMHGLCMYL